MTSELIKSLLGDLEKRVTPETEKFINQLNNVFPENSLPCNIPPKEILLTALIHNYNNFEDLFNHYRKEVFLKEDLLKILDLTPEESIVFKKGIFNAKYIGAALPPLTRY